MQSSTQTNLQCKTYLYWQSTVPKGLYTWIAYVIYWDIFSNMPNLWSLATIFLIFLYCLLISSVTFNSPVFWKLDQCKCRGYSIPRNKVQKWNYPWVKSVQARKLFFCFCFFCLPSRNRESAVYSRFEPQLWNNLLSELGQANLHFSFLDSSYVKWG